MKILIVTLLVVAVALPAVAFDLGNHALTRAAKPAGAPGAAPPPDPEVLRQGGDTVADAVRIPIPTVDLAGTTEGYADDYDVDGCPFGFGYAPDVVYSIVPEVDQVLTIDLCGSQYDTRVWVWDETLGPFLACDDDGNYDHEECGIYTSRIDDLAVAAGTEYFIVVDGWSSSSFGEYLLDVVIQEPCVVDCPPGAVPEGEPPLADDYVDLHNGGCNSDTANPPFQPITAPVFCGVSGWYLDGGVESRDTDWFTIEIPASGVLEIAGDAEYACYMFELGPQDCDQVDVLQNVTMGPCQEATMTITGAPGATVWFWVGPTVFAGPVNEFDYVLTTNLGPVATENHSWSEVKALFD